MLDAKKYLNDSRDLLHKIYQESSSNPDVIAALDAANDRLNIFQAELVLADLHKHAEVLNDLSDVLDELIADLKSKVDNFLITDAKTIRKAVKMALGQSDSSDGDEEKETGGDQADDDSGADDWEGEGPNAAEILDVAKKYLGRPYGPQPVDLTDDDWAGAFDCAEYASYCAYRAYGIPYGVRPKGTAKNTNAYTGHWRDDARERGILISEKEALVTPGAFLLRYPPDGGMGHIAISLGNGKEVYEAHSTNKGVIKNSALGRRWDTGVKIPGVRYSGDKPPMKGVFRFTGQAMDPSREVRLIQQGLARLGFLNNDDVSGLFDETTENAVSNFQAKMGLLVDGEVGKDTGTALGLGYLWGIGTHPVDEAEEDGTPNTASGVAWGGFVDRKFGNSKFKKKVIKIAQQLEMDPSHLMAVMAFETGREFSSSVRNPVSGAIGLIQFTKVAADDLGTDLASLSTMTALDQLDYVYRYYKRWKKNKQFNTLSDAYMAVLWPKAIGKEEGHVLFARPSKEYTQNAGLDLDSDGVVTKAEAAAKVEEQLRKGLESSNRG